MVTCKLGRRTSQEATTNSKAQVMFFKGNFWGLDKAWVGPPRGGEGANCPRASSSRGPHKVMYSIISEFINQS